MNDKAVFIVSDSKMRYDIVKHKLCTLLHFLLQWRSNQRVFKGILFSCICINKRKNSVTQTRLKREHILICAGESRCRVKSTASAERQTGTCCSLISVTTKSLVFHSATTTLPSSGVPHPQLRSAMREKRDKLVTTEGLETFERESTLHCSDLPHVMYRSCIVTCTEFSEKTFQDVSQLFAECLSVVLIACEL